jgi:hypothetical protein
LNRGSDGRVTPTNSCRPSAAPPKVVAELADRQPQRFRSYVIKWLIKLGLITLDTIMLELKLIEQPEGQDETKKTR